MRKLGRGCKAWLVAGVILMAPLAHGQLFGIKWDNGALYKINRSTAAITLVGQTNVPYMADLQLGPNGFLYGFNTGTDSHIYKIDPATGATTKGAKLALDAGSFVFEGAMARIGDSSKYWCAATQDAGNAKVFKLDVLTGAVSDAFTLAGTNDYNGWAFIGENTLLAINRENGKMETIDLATHSITVGDPFPGALGEVGGMTTDGTYLYFATGGTESVIPGSNHLYEMYLPEPLGIQDKGAFTGLGGYGFSGIAVPEPGTLVMVALGVGAWIRMRRKS